MATLTVKFNNNTTTETADMTETVAGTSTIGINIFRQSFPSDQVVKGDGTALTDTEILKKLWDVVKATDNSGNPIEINEDEGTGPIEILTTTHTDKFHSLISDGLVLEATSGSYILKPGYGIVFKAYQGTGAQNSATRYITYYCYLKEKSSASDEIGNLWIAYITGKKRAPLLFDVQDNRDVVFTCSGTGSSMVIRSIDTTNFLLQSTGTGYNTEVELKNTAFNLSSDDTSESKAIVEPFFCFRCSGFAD